MKKLLYILILLCCGMAIGSVTVYAGADFDDGSVIAVVKSAADNTFSLSSYSTPFGDLKIEDAENLDADANDSFSLFSAENETKAYKLTLTDKGEDEVLAAVDYLNSLDTIEYAQPNYVYTLAYTPNDRYYSVQYSLRTVSAPLLWNMNIDCSDVTVAVIDSGVNIDHIDLEDNIWSNPNEATGTSRDNDGNGYKNDIHGWDFVESDNAPYDTHGHGTHVAGIVSAVTNNYYGVASVAGSAKLVALRVTNGSTGTTDMLYKAILYVRKMGIDIVNLSLTSGSSDTLIKSAIRYTNALFVCAAGNESSNNDTTPKYPASYSYSNILSVASTTSDDTLSDFSNYGVKSVDIAAPGTAIYSTYLSGYAYMSGTSMACPLVTSAAAAVKARFPSMTPTQIAKKIISSADAVSALKEKTVSGGRLNAYRAVLTDAEWISANATPTPSPAPTPEPTPSPTPQPTPSPTPTPTPIPYVETAGEIEFTENTDQTITAALVFDTGKTPDASELKAFAAYRDSETGTLTAVKQADVNENMTITFNISEYPNCDITVYIWDKYMRPRLKPETYKEPAHI